MAHVDLQFSGRSLLTLLADRRERRDELIVEVGVENGL
jgi:hypothetical protein